MVLISGLTSVKEEDTQCHSHPSGLHCIKLLLYHLSGGCTAYTGLTQQPYGQRSDTPVSIQFSNLLWACSKMPGINTKLLQVHAFMLCNLSDLCVL